MNNSKPFPIEKSQVWRAYLKVKANQGSAGIDGESLEMFERDIKGNLYKLWNRMASGSYLAPPVKGVPIPKKTGGVRVLGIPTVADRIAQMVVKEALEPKLEPIFDVDSYGYRPGKSAHDAIEITRRRCWKLPWVLEFDIRGLFDNIPHDLLLRAVKHHTKENWIIHYVNRWLKVPMIINGQAVCRDKGTPQGGVISPLLANLFLHYAFDSWMRREFPSIPFARYADDGLAHCKTLEQAKHLLARLKDRFAECGLEIHPDKTHIVYCKDVHRRDKFDTIQFTFLGFDFRPRKTIDRIGRCFANFSPGMSRSAKKQIIQTIRGWHIHLRVDKSLEDLSDRFDPVLRGWLGYYGRFYRYAMKQIWDRINLSLVNWLMHKYKDLKGHKTQARKKLAQMAEKNRNLFAHWKLGYYPKENWLNNGSRMS